MAGNKHASGRLGVFARASSETQNDTRMPNSNRIAVSGSRNNQQTASEVRMRREVADEAKIMIPPDSQAVPGRDKALGHAAPMFVQTSSSPPPERTASPERIQGRVIGDFKRDIFAGSMLEEDFTQTGYSTPLREEELLLKGDSRNKLNEVQFSESGQVNPFEESPKSKKVIPYSHQYSDRPGLLQFSFNEDGLMDVVDTQPQQSRFAIGDGFQKEQHQKSRNDGQKIRRHEERLPSSDGRPNRAVQVRRSFLSRGSNRDMAGGGRAAISLDDTDSVYQAFERKSRNKNALKEYAGDDLALEYQKHDDNEKKEEEDGEEVEVANEEEEEDLHATPKAKRSLPRRGSEIRTHRNPNALDQTSLTKRKQRPAPEFEDAALAAMSMKELQERPFDVDPVPIAVQDAQNEASERLEEKLSRFSTQDADEQQRMLSSLSLEDWEASGDWFAERFADLMNQLRDARKSKRGTVAAFEAEAAAREEAIRLRLNGIDLKLAQMKQNGQRVVGSFKSESL